MPSTLTQQEFIRRFLAKKGLISWLIGAGASVSANMPTASNIVWDLKKKFYCSEENQEFQGNDIQVAPVREKIQSYLDSKGYPAQSSNEEYSFYFKLLFGDDYSKQRDYIQDALNPNKISISAGQRVLAGLIATDFIPSIFTTNFDEVVEKSFAKISGNNLSPFHIEGSDAALDALNSNKFPIYVKLHGDYRYKSLLNLEQDLRTANEQLGKCFIQAGSRFGFIVIGYSGRDKSVMKLMHSVLSSNNPYPHGLYWVFKKNSKLSPDVESLLEKAKSKKVDVHLVEIDDYVALMSSIWKQIPNKANALNDAVAGSNRAEVNIPLPPPGENQPLLRFNCLPIQALPDTVYRVTPKSTLGWEEIREIRFTHRQLIIFIDEGIFVWGEIKDIQSAFGDECRISEEDISGKIAKLNEHMAVKGALEDALCKAISRKAGLIIKRKHHSKFLTVPNNSDSNRYEALEAALGVIAGDVPNVKVIRTDRETSESTEIPLAWSEAIQVSLTSIGGNYVAVFRPTIWISPMKELKLARDFIFRRVGNRKNDVMDKILSAWVKTITIASTNKTLSISAFPDANMPGKASFQLITKTSYSKKV